MADVQFLFDNQLIAELENLIKNSKYRLLLISPFIDLDRRIQDALRDKLSKYDFELLVLFGKNEDNYYKSIKKDSLDFLMQFPNVEIRYNDRLHAKFYQNDFDYIMTSLNLYDYSLAKNIEVGIIGNFASKGLIGKMVNGTNTLIAQGVDKINQDVFGLGHDVNPIEKFQTIFHDSELKYKTEPVIVDKDGIKGVFGGKKLNGFNVKVNTFSNLVKESKINKSETVSFVTQETKSAPNAETISYPSIKIQSSSQLSKALGVTQADIINIMQQSGLINGDKITSAGLSKGLVMKNYMGKDYIAYPDNLSELNKLKTKGSYT
jgi:hypothetical protein